MTSSPRQLRVAAIQTGPVAAGPEEAVDDAFRLLDQMESTPDLVVLPELFSRPFWCVGASNSEYLSWAESLDGPTLSRAAKHVKSLGIHAVVPFFECGDVPGEFYNSAAVLAPDGQLLQGTLDNGGLVDVYRKNFISAYNWGGSRNDEKYYFRPGAGFPTFQTELGRVGVLICYDRWFPEAWRALGLAGAEIICVANASSGRAAELFIPSIRTWAAQNVVFVVAANRWGYEVIEGVETHYYGSSCVASPTGQVLDGASDGAPGVAVSQIDVDDVVAARSTLTMYRDRRPELDFPHTGND